MTSHPFRCTTAALLGATLFLTTACQTGPRHSESHPLLPDHAALTAALRTVQKEQNGGFGLPMWATLVDPRRHRARRRDAAAQDRGDQWPGSRVISAQKANTANAFCLPGLVPLDRQPVRGDAAGRQPVRPAGQQSGRCVKVAYAGDAGGLRHGRAIRSSAIGIGGVNVFGGGLGALRRRAACCSAASASAATARWPTT